MLNLFQGGDKEAGPAADLRVVSLVDRGVQQARSLDREPEVQTGLYQTLGLMYQKLGRFDRAESLLHSALERSQSIRGSDKSLVANNLIDLALVESDEGKFKDAERSALNAIDNIQRLRPKDENLLARAESAQGMILVSERQSSRALGPLNGALVIQTKRKQPSIELAETLDILGDAQIYLGNYRQSEEFYRRSLVIHRQVYGENHPKVAEDLRNIAEVEETKGRYGEAEQNEREGLQIVESWYGKEHPATASQMASLASTLLYEMKDISDVKYSEAKDLPDRALVIQEKTYGSQSSKVAYVLDSLGAAAQYGRDYKNAETYFRQEEAIYKSIYSASDYRYAIAMANLASTYLKENRSREAELSSGKPCNSIRRPSARKTSILRSIRLNWEGPCFTRGVTGRQNCILVRVSTHSSNRRAQHRLHSGGQQRFERDLWCFARTSEDGRDPEDGRVARVLKD